LKQQTPLPKCFHCGSELILVSEVTEVREGARFPQTTIKYRCSNQECQDEIDKQTAKRIKILEDKAINDQKRLEKKQLEKEENLKK
jgi:DNA-directed RNA polymerase subunit RPC12/RpoP